MLNFTVGPVQMDEETRHIGSDQAGFRQTELLDQLFSRFCVGK